MGTPVAEDWGSFQATTREGTAHANAALSSSDVRRIRARHAAGIPRQDLARDAGVSIATINRIIAGKTYRDVGPAEEIPAGRQRTG